MNKMRVINRQTGDIFNVKVNPYLPSKAYQAIEKNNPLGYIIRRNAAVPVDGFKLIEVQKTVVGFLLDLADFTHNNTASRKVIIINYSISE